MKREEVKPKLDPKYVLVLAIRLIKAASARDKIPLEEAISKTLQFMHFLQRNGYSIADVKFIGMHQQENNTQGKKYT